VVVLRAVCVRLSDLESEIGTLRDTDAFGVERIEAERGGMKGRGTDPFNRPCHDVRGLKNGGLAELLKDTSSQVRLHVKQPIFTVLESQLKLKSGKRSHRHDVRIHVFASPSNAVRSCIGWGYRLEGLAVDRS
jgi:hypothetical protein